MYYSLTFQKLDPEVLQLKECRTDPRQDLDHSLTQLVMSQELNGRVCALETSYVCRSLSCRMCACWRS
jgi:hypothetical protein